MLKANLIFTNKPIAEYMEIKNKISCFEKDIVYGFD